jgi:glycosyltransferase involved in cell wall biosynthesis
MINVLYLIDTMAYGGTQTHIASMLRGHDRRRFNPFLLCLQQKGSLGEQLEAEGFSVTSYGLKRIYALRAARSYPRYIGFLRGKRIDVVHAYLFAGQAYGIPGARIAGVPLVIAGRRAVGVYWTAAKYRAVRMVTNRLAHLHVGNSLAVRDFVIHQEGIPGEKVRVVYNGIDASRFHPAAVAGGRGGVTVGYMGSLTRVKMLDVLLKAMSIAAREQPGLRAVICGEGPGEARRWYEGETDRALTALAEALALTDRVTFTGPVARPEEAMRGMDIFVMPSVSEGMSNAVIEAMATGIPVIASDSGGNREVVLEGSTGRLFPPGDERRLAALILELARDAGARQAMGRAGRARALDLFTVRRMVEEMEAVYEGGLAGRKG